MAKSRYIDHIEQIKEMQSQGKVVAEIAKYLNMNFNINASENSLRVFLKRYYDNQKGKDSNIQEQTGQLSELIEKTEKKYVMQKEEAILHEKLMSNLTIIKNEYEELNETILIVTGKLKEIAKQAKDRNDRWKLYCMVAGGWILSILLSMFAGYYLGRCYPRTLFHYILTMTGIPAGIFIGLAIGFFKPEKNKKKVKKQPV